MWDSLLAALKAVADVVSHFVVIASAIGVVWGLIVRAKKKLSKQSPEKMRGHRLALKSEFEEKLASLDELGSRCDAIVLNERDKSAYLKPVVSHRGIGPSNWFKVEVRGLYQNGVEVILDTVGLRINHASGEWSFAQGEKTDDHYFGLKVGRIPFSGIITLDWSGDEYHPFLHMYCRFDGYLRTPYETFRYYVKEPNRGHFVAIDEFRPWETGLTLFKRVILWIRLWLDV